MFSLGLPSRLHKANTAVSRYDVRLLLDTLPPSTSGPGDIDTARLSPTGWSDLPSDSEDTFFFSPDEVEDYHREKRRRMIDQSREERLRALRAESGDDAAREEEDPWGGSDEEVLASSLLPLCTNSNLAPRSRMNLRRSSCDEPPLTS